MAEELRTPGYVAYLPAKVRYDNGLTPNAKLLYAEITALADKCGCCWASNDYFAKLFDLTGKSISRLISGLNDKGYIVVEVLRDPVTQAVVKRRIWVDTPPLKKEETSPHGSGDPPHEKEGTPPPKKEEYNNPNKLNDIPPISPKSEKPKRGELTAEVRAIIEEYSGGLPALYESLEAFMEVRSKRKAVNSPAAVKLLLSKLDKLSGGNEELRQQLVDTAIENGWKSVYPLKTRQSSPAAYSPGHVVEEVDMPEW